MLKKPVLLLITCAFMAAGCNTINIPPSVTVLSGHWLVLYADHHLNTETEEKAYGMAQDSILRPMGLTLVNFTPDGRFYYTDSLFGKQGYWTIKEKVLHIEKGGGGFNYFNGSIGEIKRGVMKVDEQIKLDNETIHVTWYLKKIGDQHKHRHLFDSTVNWWRKPPATAESDAALVKRTGTIVDYYADYFELIAKEATYFMPLRVHLPLAYYQHAIGMQKFDSTSMFTSFFHSVSDAKKANDIIRKGIRESGDYPKGDNYVIEYASYLKLLGTAILKMKS